MPGVADRPDCAFVPPAKRQRSDVVGLMELLKADTPDTLLG